MVAGSPTDLDCLSWPMLQDMTGLPANAADAFLGHRNVTSLQIMSVSYLYISRPFHSLNLHSEWPRH